MTTLHILVSPHSPVHVDNTIDAFSIIVYKFIKNMTKLGWSCIHYGIPGSNVDCENIICLDNVPEDYHERISKYNLKASEEIGKRKKPDDFILCFFGTENKEACDAHPELKIVEPSIGYTTTAAFARYKVFVSYAQMHYYYGQQNQLMNPSWNDDVIYNPISKTDFDYTEDKDDYFLYFGRVIETKGIHVAIQATEVTGKKLIIAGPGNLSDLGYDKIPSHVEMAGPCNATQRRNLMAKAAAILGPTYYIEPFGNMIPEAYMSGTPAITTDWGGFTETVVQGKTGFRCRDFKEFVSAILNVKSIRPIDCRDWAITNCEDSVIYAKYNRYFNKIKTDNFYR